MPDPFTQKFRKDESGTVLVFVAMCLVVVVGMGALTFDLGRLAATQGDLQSYVDNVALAAAGELDGSPDSIARARDAAAAMIRDTQTFADGGQSLGSVADYALRFLSGLPADDNASVTPFVTADPETASMVEVRATPRVVFLPFGRALASLVGAAQPNEDVGAVAIAGFTAYVCDVPVLMFCMPASSTSLVPGVSVQLRTGGNGAAWGAGNFGFLDPSDEAVDPGGPCAGLTGSKRYTCLIASGGNRDWCFAQTSVDLKTGQQVGVGNAVFNTRFDMYNSTLSQTKNDPVYAPAPHTITGLQSASGKGNQCLGNNTELSEDTMAFPPDDCFATNTCGGSGRFGNGNWTNGRVNYVNMNYGVTPGEQGTPDPFNSANTRFEYYKAEIKKASGSNILLNRSETGSATCFQGTPSTNVNRRVFLAAGVDCVTNSVNGSAKNVPVDSYFEIFLIRPVGALNGSPGTFNLDVEIIGEAGGSGQGNSKENGIVRDVVVLYR